jgi:MYXO-CTERM domain-containing protein
MRESVGVFHHAFDQDPEGSIPLYPRRALLLYLVAAFASSASRDFVMPLGAGRLILLLLGAVFVVTTDAEWEQHGNRESSVEVSEGSVKRSAPASELGAWRASSVLPPTRTRFGVAISGRRVYLAGGQSSPTALTSDVSTATIDDDGTVSAAGWSSAAALPSARSSVSLVAYDGFVFALGGCSMANCEAAALFDEVLVSAASPTGALSGFRATTALPRPRTLGSALASDGWLWIFGGRTATGPSNEILRAPINADGSLGAWRQAGSMPRALERHRVVPHDGQWYLLGGTDGSAPMLDIFRGKFDSNADVTAWVSVGRLPAARLDFAAVAARSLLVILGGHSDPGGAALGDALLTPIAATGFLGRWQTRPLATTTATVLGAVATSGHVLAFGAAQISGPVTSVFSAPFSPLSDLPLTPLSPLGLTTPLPVMRFSHGAAAWGGRLYVAGGCAEQLSISSSCSRYLNDVQHAQVLDDGGLGSFVAANSFSGPRRGHVLNAAEGFLYLSGGTDDLTTMTDVQSARILPDGSLGRWTVAGALPQPRSFHAAVVAGNRLIVAGGGPDPLTAPSDTVWSAPLVEDGGLGAFALLPSLPAPLAGHSLEAYAGHLYAVGGFNDDSFKDTVSVADLAADGGLGPWRFTSALPSPREGHVGGASHGYLFTFGGYYGGFPGSAYLDEVLAAKVGANGDLGNWTQTGTLAIGRDATRGASSDGFFYVTGGLTGGFTGHDEVEALALNVPSPRGIYTTRLDLPSGDDGGLSALAFAGAALAGGRISLSHRTAKVDGIFGPMTDVGPITLGETIHLSDPAAKHLWVKLQFDDTTAIVTDRDGGHSSVIDSIFVSTTLVHGEALPDAGPRVGGRYGVGCGCQSAQGPGAVLLTALTCLAARRRRRRHDPRLASEAA